MSEFFPFSKLVVGNNTNFLVNRRRDSSVRIHRV